MKNGIFRLTSLDTISPLFPEASLYLGLAIQDKGYDWYAYIKDSSPVGFAAIAKVKQGFFPAQKLEEEMLYRKCDGAEIKYFYVTAEDRNQKIGSKILEEILECYPGTIKSVILPEAEAFYSAHGFIAIGSRGRYPIVYRRGKS
jgi:GNAT superfamily N-acetyltransferase